MEKISQEVLKQIKQSKISPRPKWFFKFKNFIFWFLFIISVIFGGFSIGTLIYQYENQNSFTAYYHLSNNFLESFFLAIPYFWLIIFLVLIAFSIYDYFHTKKGYRYNVLIIAGLSLLISLILGISFFYLGLGKTIDQQLNEKVSFYYQLNQQKEKVWDQPEKGLIAGTIKEIKSNNTFLLEDLSGKSWQVNYPNAQIFGRAKVKIGEQIKIVGKKQNADEFNAQQIKPYSGNAMQKGKGKNGVK